MDNNTINSTSEKRVFKGFVLDQFQIESIDAIEKNYSVVVSAPTGSGKTLIADYIINKHVSDDTRIIYTAPIKALSNQKYKEFSKDYGEDKVGIMTGDVVINPDAKIVIMTTEIYRNMVMTADVSVNNVAYVIFDEIHYINDRERGVIWEESIIFSPKHVRFLCLSATIPNADEFASWVQTIKEHTVITVKHTIRSVPLEKHFFDADLGICTLKEIKDIKDIPQYHKAFRKKGKKDKFQVKGPSHIDLVSEIRKQSPILFFCFSRLACEKHAKELAQKSFFKGDPEISKTISKYLSRTSPETKQLKSTVLLRETLPRGIGFHHAGILPIIKEMVEELFSKGLISVLYTTETFAVGINMPAKSVCFESLRKFDGLSFRLLNSKEFFQIAGRAGRRGIDTKGFVYTMVDKRDFEYNLYTKITARDVDPIISQFRLGVNSALNLIKRHTKEQVEVILTQSFFEFQKSHLKIPIRQRYVNLIKKLKKKGFILEDDTLTEKGEFASNIFCDEVLFAEMFATDFKLDLNEYQILLIVATMAYEDKERVKFRNMQKTQDYKELQKKLATTGFSQDPRLSSMYDITCIVNPLFNQQGFFKILDNTTMQEGDLIRYIGQILDRISQLERACTDFELRAKLGNCFHMVKESVKDISVI